MIFIHRGSLKGRSSADSEADQTCGPSDNCAAQMSLTLTLSRHRERELEPGERTRKEARRGRSPISSFTVLTGPQRRILFFLFRTDGKPETCGRFQIRIFSSSVCPLW